MRTEKFSFKNNLAPIEVNARLRPTAVGTRMLRGRLINSTNKQVIADVKSVQAAAKRQIAALNCRAIRRSVDDFISTAELEPSIEYRIVMIIKTIDITCENYPLLRAANSQPRSRKS